MAYRMRHRCGSQRYFILHAVILFFKAVWALGNIAGDTLACRNMVLEQVGAGHAASHSPNGILLSHRLLSWLNHPCRL